MKTVLYIYCKDKVDLNNVNIGFIFDNLIFLTVGKFYG